MKLISASEYHIIPFKLSNLLSKCSTDLLMSFLQAKGNLALVLIPPLIEGDGLPFSKIESFFVFFQ
jgi:hypothetical protein